jgi:hypothetical protein
MGHSIIFSVLLRCDYPGVKGLLLEVMMIEKIRSNLYNDIE